MDEKGIKMELALNDFLSQLGNDTVNRLNREKRVKDIPETQSVKKEQTVQIPQKRINKPEIMEEDNSRLDEDFIETALDYASVVIKTVRKSFETTAEKRKVFESIRSAIDVYLGEYNSQQAPSLFPTGATGKMTESEFNSMPTTSQSQIPGNVRMNDLSGQTVNLDNQTPKNVMNNQLNIGIVQGNDGKKHADLSQLNENDIKSLRVLSGIEKAPE